ncbi:MAG: c-type cytochrome biogenesis protein CcsB [Actinobacteria bacterium]|nr:c-type cytochrome biogenesis protein CcsB [Actinomycetota bacterium]NBY16012.1 c-type cytochrome biogenesis protein CcsB [Actinomycetota bacterium]
MLVYAAMTGYVVAMVAFAISLSKSRRIETLQETAARVSAVSPAARQGGTATLADASVSTALSDGDVLGSGRRSGNIGMSVTWLATLLLGAAIICRGLSASRLPWGNMYEFSLAAGFSIAFAYCVLSLKRDLRWLGLFIVVPVLLDLGIAATILYTDSAELVPALQSYWLAIHVTAATVCVGAFTVGAALSALYLVAERAEAKVIAGEEPGRIAFLANRLPTADRLDLMAYRIHAFMFPIWTFAVISGAIWAEAAWGRYWGWDPKETWAFITWVIYAAYLHARVTVGWRGRKAAYIALAGISAILINYFVVNILIPGLHSYSGVK